MTMCERQAMTARPAVKMQGLKYVVLCNTCGNFCCRPRFFFSLLDKKCQNEMVGRVSKNVSNEKVIVITKYLLLLLLFCQKKLHR